MTIEIQHRSGDGLTNLARKSIVLQMKERTRAETMTIRINADEQAMVRALAEADGISVSDVVRMSIRRQHGERFGVRKAKAKR